MCLSRLCALFIKFCNHVPLMGITILVPYIHVIDPLWIVVREIHFGCYLSPLSEGLYYHTIYSIAGVPNNNCLHTNWPIASLLSHAISHFKISCEIWFNWYKKLCYFLRHWKSESEFPMGFCKRYPFIAFLRIQIQLFCLLMTSLCGHAPNIHTYYIPISNSRRNYISEIVVEAYCMRELLMVYTNRQRSQCLDLCSTFASGITKLTFHVLRSEYGWRN